MKLIFVTIIFFTVFRSVFSANILVIIPCPSRSHLDVFEPLMSALVHRGHRLWVVSNFPQRFVSSNYTSVDIRDVMPDVQSHIPFIARDLCTDHYFSVYHNLRFMFENVKSSERILNLATVKELLTVSVRFDVILVESFSNDVFVGFANKFGAPLIALTSSIPFPWHSDRIGSVDNPSYVTHFYSRFPGRMDFTQRMVNTLHWVFARAAFAFFNHYAESAARRFYGDDLPSLQSMVMNTSLMFVNSYHVLNGVRPTTPQLVEVGGIHIRPANQLPLDIETFINESEHGVVYFSMGSMVRMSTLSHEKLSAFRTVLSGLRQRVLWKWEDDTMPGQPGNVKIAKWLPQRDILAHPNVKLFVYHGGLLGITEAVYCGVPMIGIPLYGDQPANVAAVVSAGAGLQLSIHNISEKSVGYAVNTVLNDSRFADNARRLSELYRDRPMSPLDTALYWTEYVIRHKGALHLQSAVAHLAWYQYLLLDVASIISAAILAIVAIIYYLTKHTLVFFVLVKSRTLCKQSGVIQ